MFDELKLHHQQDSEKMICTICIVGFDYSATNVSFRIKQHIESDKHKIQQLTLHSRRQASLQFTDQQINKFYEGIAECFVSANIPLHKLQNINLKSIFEKWTARSLPDESTIRKKYIPEQFNKVIQQIKDKLAGKDYYVMVDEATDLSGRFLLVFMVDILILLH